MSAFHPLPVRRFERIDSTNAEALRLAAAGEQGPLWIRADRQDQGRGRQGRHWVSDQGNLFATLLLPTAAPLDIVPQLGFVAAVAVHDALSHLDIHAVSLKWPNDVLLEGAKVCGILSEVAATTPVTVALGLGLNVAHAPEGMPYPVTSLAAHGLAVTADSVFEKLAASLGMWLKIWGEGRGFPSVRLAWLERCFGLNSPVTAQGPEGPLAGYFRDLGKDGALMLETPDRKRHAIHSGEVHFASMSAAGHLT